jgi:DNA-binding NarL/FixJ family response regulator
MTDDGDAAASAGREMMAGIWTVASSRPLTSVLICDDRPPAREAMSEMLGALPGLSDILCVTEGFELVDAFAARPADLVLIGIHHASTAGADATDLLLGLHPTAAVIVFGSPTETDILAAAYARGARGLLLWDPDNPQAGGIIH